MNEKDYFIDELERLVDTMIVGVVVSGKGYERYYGLKIDDPIMEKGYILWFLRDEEANGPGSFVIEDYDTCENFEEV